MDIGLILFSIMLLACFAAVLIAVVVLVRGAKHLKTSPNNKADVPNWVNLPFGAIFIAGGIWKLLSSGTFKEVWILGVLWLMLGIYFIWHFIKGASNEKT